MPELDESPRPELMALLADAKANPSDDGPRLILADWLEEHGEPKRAEFVRLGVEQSRLAPGWRADLLHDRARELLARNEKRWLGPLADVAIGVAGSRGLLQVRFWWDRLCDSESSLRDRETWGWVETARVHPLSVEAYQRLTNFAPLGQVGGCIVETSSSIDRRAFADWLRTVRWQNLAQLTLHGGALHQEGMSALASSARLASLRKLALRGVGIPSESTPILARSPWLGGLTDLELHGNHLAWNDVAAANFQALAGSSILARLESLKVTDNWLKPADIKALASAVFDKLRVLELSQNGFGDPGAEHLANAWMPAVESLGLRATALRSDGVLQILRSEGWPSLKHLDLAYLPLGEEGFRALAGESALSRIVSLELGHTRPPPAGPALRSLAHSRGVVNLRYLGLENIKIGADGCRALASSPTLAGLESLCLNSCDVGPMGVTEFLRASWNLRELELQSAGLGDEGVVTLVDCWGQWLLERLDVTANHLSSIAARSLLDSTRLERLKRLQLSHNTLGDKRIEDLAGSPGLARLRDLGLQSVGMTSRGARALANSPHAAGLLSLNLRDNQIDDAGAHALADSPNLGSVVDLDMRNNPMTGEGKLALRRRFGWRVNY